MLPCCLTTPGPDTRIPSFQYPASVRNACNTQGVGGRDEDCRWPTLVHRGSTIHTRRLQQSLLPHRGIPLQDSSKEDLPHWRGEKGRGPSRKGIVVNAAISEHSPPKSDGTNVESERYEKYRRQNSGRKVGVASRGWGHALYLDAHRTTGKLSIGGPQAFTSDTALSQTARRLEQSVEAFRHHHHHTSPAIARCPAVERTINGKRQKTALGLQADPPPNPPHPQQLPTISHCGDLCTPLLGALSMTASPKPIVLLLGEVLHAQVEWNALSSLAELRQINTGDREEFMSDCAAGVHNGILAISRTYDSVELTGRFDRDLIRLLPQTLKFISHNGAGYDQIDAEACANRGIAVSNTPGAADASTATTAIYLLLGALRRVHIPATALRAGKWRGSMGLGHDPEGKTLGILGMGGIGTAFALRAAPFDFHLQYHNRNPVMHPSKNPTNAKYVSFEELIRTSDVISIHLPLNDTTRGLIGRKEFRMMKDGVVIVNTARGKIIDEAALVQALEQGKVFAAGLDVYEREPKIHPGLIKNDNVVLMPHIGTATMETQRKMEVLVIDNIRNVLEEGSLLTPVVETRSHNL
ncbi:MAG: hypothetical protein LQ341_001810 [Variospora aurantia]|nr:MAG: hypothetical protein LQ341_001810 [Variospora aurantia]